MVKLKRREVVLESSNVRWTETEVLPKKDTLSMVASLRNLYFRLCTIVQLQLHLSLFIYIRCVDQGVREGRGAPLLLLVLIDLELMLDYII